MKSIALDTNAILDYFLKQPGYRKTKSVLQRAVKGTVIIFIPLPAFLEVYWSLTKFYRLPKETISKWLLDLILLPNCLIPDKNIVIDAVNLYNESAGVSLNDCLIVQFSRRANVDEFLTSDRKLKKLYTRL